MSAQNGKAAAMRPSPSTTPPPEEPETPDPPAAEAAPPDTAAQIAQLLEANRQMGEANRQLMEMLQAQQQAQAAAPAAAPPQVDIEAVAGQRRRAIGGYDIVPPPDHVAPDQFGRTEDGKAITIHFVADGLTFADKTWFGFKDPLPWYVGDEVTVAPGDPAWPLIHDANGKCLIVDDDAQFDRYGQVYYLAGPWRGRGYTDRVKFDVTEVYDELNSRGSGRDFDGYTDREKRILAEANRIRGLAGIDR